MNPAVLAEKNAAASQTLIGGSTMPLSLVSDINVSGRDRAIADEALAKANGFALPPPVYAIGTSVIQLGADNFRASRSEWEALPETRESCDRLRDLVLAEERQDIEVAAGDLVMLENGLLRQISTGLVLPLEERALHGLCGLVIPGGRNYLIECPSDLRAYNFNRWASGAKAEKVVNLRTRLSASNGGARVINAVVSARYAKRDMNDLAMDLKAALPPGARGTVVYDGYQARVDAMFHSDIVPSSCVAGEIFKGGASITTADDGSRAIKIPAQLWRNLCRNLIIIGHSSVVETVRHQGGNIAERVGVALNRAMSRIDGFADRWNAATMENVLDKYEASEPRILFAAMVKARLVTAPGFSGDALVDRLMSAWDHEPGYTRAAFVNAVTRAAHTEEWASWEQSTQLEEQAGQLLYAKVWNVADAVEEVSAN